MTPPQPGSAGPVTDEPRFGVFTGVRDTCLLGVTVEGPAGGLPACLTLEEGEQAAAPWCMGEALSLKTADPVSSQQPQSCIVWP